jgi:hypothetical protein
MSPPSTLAPDARTPAPPAPRRSIFLAYPEVQEVLVMRRANQSSCAVAPSGCTTTRLASDPAAGRAVVGMRSRSVVREPLSTTEATGLAEEACTTGTEYRPAFTQAGTPAVTRLAVR